MEIQQLRHLSAAANCVSYAQAAKKCFTSRQNIAHSVKAIEAELGVVLFERQGNGMVLTEAGKRVAPLAEEIIEKVDGMKTMFAAPSATDFTLSLAVSVNLFAGMPEGIDKVFAGWSDCLQFLELDAEQCYEHVCSGKVEAAIVMCMDRPFPKCNSMRIGGSIAYALVNEVSNLARKNGCLASDFLDKKLIIMSEPTFQYEPLFERLDEMGYDRSSVSVLPSTSSMVHLVRTRGEAFVSIPSRKFAMNPPRGTVSIPIVDPKMNWGFYVLYRAGEQRNEKVMSFIHSVRRAFAGSEISSAHLVNKE